MTHCNLTSILYRRSSAVELFLLRCRKKHLCDLFKLIVVSELYTQKVAFETFQEDIYKATFSMDLCGSSLFPVGTGGLDAHRMITGNDTGGDVWTVAGAW